MILNYSGKPFRSFSSAQRNACNGVKVVDVGKEHYSYLPSALADTQQIVAVIVRAGDWWGINDIVNNLPFHTPVYTLDVEVDGETGKHNFVAYETES